MNHMVDIELVQDEKCLDPKIRIFSKERTRLVENIIIAIENVSENDYPFIVAAVDDTMEFISQRDIYRIYTEGRKLRISTADRQLYAKKSISAIEEDLDPTRFLRISQSEIINIYKVRRFDVSLAGTIGVEFDNGDRTWVSRGYVREIKSFLNRENYREKGVSGDET